MNQREELKQIFEQLANEHQFKKISSLVQDDIRHKSGVTDRDYLNSFLRTSRCFAYATQDDSWGEFEKHWHIIIRRLVIAEQACKEHGINLEEWEL